MLRDEEFDRLLSVGWARLPGVVPPRDVAAVTERVWAFFAKRGVLQDDPTNWPSGFASKLQGLRQSGMFNVFANPTTTALLDQLLGEDSWSESEAWGPALVTWPQPGPWQLPHKNWHFDLPGRGDPDQPKAARLFGFVSSVEPRGGGTLVVEGSHQLICRLLAEHPNKDLGQSNDLRRRLSERYPWFAALSRPGGDRVQQFMLDGDQLDGVRVRVVELSGNPGEIVAMLPWSMHTWSMNTTADPRFMVTHTVMRHDQSFYPTVASSPKRGPAPLHERAAMSSTARADRDDAPGVKEPTECPAG